MDSRTNTVRSRPGLGARIAKPIVLIPVALLIPLIVAPMVFLVYGSFQSDPPGQNGTWTLQNYDVLRSGDFLELVLNSLILAVAVTMVSLIAGTALAVALTRWDVPAAKFFDAVAIVPAYIPAFVGAIAWSFLLAPQSGYLNAALTALGFSPINIFSWGGVIGVSSLYSIPLVYLYMRPALLSVNKSMEEAARLLGAGRFRVVRQILLPAITPAVSSSALIVFINTLGEFASLGYSA